MSDFLFVPRYTIWPLDFIVYDVNNAQVEADDEPVASFRNYSDDTEVFSRATTAVVGETGVYRLTLSSIESGTPGLYYITFSYDLDTVAQMERIDLEVSTSRNGAYLALPDNAKAVVERVWNKFEDLFDSAIGGPHLREYAQSSFGRDRVAELCETALMRINTTSQPHQTNTLTSFPYAGFGGLLELATYCVAPETRVLSANLRWVPAGSLTVGDEIVAFDEEIVDGKFRTATIEATQQEVRPRVRVETSNGVLYCTPEHRFVVRYRTCEYDGTVYYKRKWVEAQDLIPGKHEIVSVGDPWSDDTSFAGGWLAGMLDGEGCLTFSPSGSPRLSISQKPGPVMDRLVSEVQSRVVARGGDAVDVAPISKNGSALNLNVPGGFLGAVRLLGEIRTERLHRHPRFRELWEGKALRSTTLPGVTVLSVEPSLDGPVSVIQTSTGTMITEGLLSHNCEVIKHLIRSYVEQPNAQGIRTARLDRTGYSRAWADILKMEEKDLRDALQVFKISSLSLGKASVLVAGGVYGEWVRPTPPTRPRVRQPVGWMR